MVESRMAIPKNIYPQECHADSDGRQWAFHRMPSY